MKKRHISMSAVFRTLLVGSLVLIIVCSYVTQSIANSALIHQALSSSSSLLRVYVRETDSQASEFERYLYQTLSSNSDLKRLRMSGDEYEMITAKQNLSSLFQQALSMYPIASGVTLIHSEGEKVPPISNSYQTNNYADVLAINAYIQGCIREGSYEKNQWFCAEIQGLDNLLLRIIPFEGYDCCVWITMENINHSLEEYDLGEGSIALLCSEDGTVLNRSGFDLPVAFEQKKQGQFIQMNQPMSIGEFRIVSLLPEQNVTKDLHSIRSLLFLFILLLLLVFPITFVLVKRSVYNPVANLIGAMEKAAKGDLKVQADETVRLAEFQTVNRYFNHMMEEIHNVKIEAYENKLREQKVKRHFLQSQIKSHFYLNCLNIIYMLAQSRDYRSIEELSMCLVKYFRYMSANTNGLAALGNEIAHVENYIDIQKFRYPGKIECQVTVAGSDDDCEIPALVLQTFVENSVKYGRRDGEITRIEIQITVDAGYCRILIRDNGKGFPVNLLGPLNGRSDDIEMDGLEGIGIKNVKSRLDLLYHGRANIAFENNQGAVVRIRIPYQRGGEI